MKRDGEKTLELRFEIFAFRTFRQTFRQTDQETHPLMGAPHRNPMNIRFFTVFANIGYFFPDKLIKTLPLATITVYV